MTMFNKEMLDLIAQDPTLEAQAEALIAAAAVARFRADVKANAEAAAKADAQADAAKAAKAKAEAEAAAKAEFLKAYPEGYIYVKTATEVTRLKAAAREVGLHAKTFVEEVVGDSFIKVVFMEPKKGGKRG